MANVKGYVVGVDERPEKEAFQADIIQLRGTVHGSKGRGYLNYLTLGGGTPGQAWNIARVQERAGTPVWIGYEQNEPVILSLDKSRLEPNGAQGYRSPLFAQHAPDHGWGSGDPDYLDTRRIRDLMVRPAGLFKVTVLPGWFSYGGGELYFSGQQNVDLSSAQPAAGAKRGVGLYLDSDKTVKTISGGAVARTATLPEPAWPAGAFKLALVILYGHKLFIDFEDVKQRKRIWAGGGGWPFENIVPVTSEAGLIAAIAAADANTIIMLDSDITLTSTLVINKPVTLASLSGESTVTLGHPVADGAAAIVIQDTDDEFVTFLNVTISAFEWNVISATNSSLRFIDCTLIIDGSPSVEQVYCVQIERNTSGSGICRLKATDTQFLSADVGADYGWGILGIKDGSIGSSALELEIESGRFWLPSGDIEVDDADLYLFNPVLRSVPTLTDTATMTGSWLDGAGVRWPGPTALYAEDGDGPASSPAWAVDTGGNLEGVSGLDVYPDGDVFGLWGRLINYGFTPDEHWAQNVDELAWTGWASYTGFVTPDTLAAASNSIYRVAHSTGAVKAFRYRAAATGGQIYLRTRCSITQVAIAGVMIDDGVDDGDGEGAANFIRVYISQASAGAAIQIISQHRTGGGAVTTSTYTPEIPPVVFIGVGINTTGTLWSSWSGQPFLFGESGERLILATLAAMSWTPARVGIYFASSAAGAGRRGLYDWYDEATS